MFAIEWCPWVVAQVAVFMLKTVDVSDYLPGAFIMNLFPGGGSRSVIEYYSIRLVCNVATRFVRLRSSRAWIGFTVGILALARVWVVRYA